MDFPTRPGSSERRRGGRGGGGELAASEELGAYGPFDSAGEEGEPDIPTFVDPEPDSGDEPRERAPEGRSPRASKPGKARGRRSETLARLLFVIPWIAAIIAVVALGGPVFAVAMVGFACIGLTEFFRMTVRARPFQFVAYLTVAAMSVAAYFGDTFQVLLVAAAMFPVMLGFMIARGDLQGVTWSVAVTVFGVIWIGIPFAHAVLLRELPDHGGALLVDVLVATFLTDTFAYLGGRMFGQRPLSPTISPNKTIEGMLIGVAGGVLGFWLAGLYQDWLSGPQALLFGLCIALLAPLGDLFESAIKRDLDVKDSGRMMGPHGGLLDRLDAVLFTVVAGYYLALAIVY